MDERWAKEMGERMAAATLSDNTENFLNLANMWAKWMADENDAELRNQYNLWMAEAFCRECNRTGVANSGWGTNVK